VLAHAKRAGLIEVAIAKVKARERKLADARPRLRFASSSRGRRCSKRRAA